MTPVTAQIVERCPPPVIVDRVLCTDRRVLLFGQPGVGKSTLARELATALYAAGRASWCISFWQSP